MWVDASKKMCLAVGSSLLSPPRHPAGSPSSSAKTSPPSSATLSSISLPHTWLYLQLPECLVQAITSVHSGTAATANLFQVVCATPVVGWIRDIINGGFSFECDLRLVALEWRLPSPLPDGFTLTCLQTSGMKIFFFKACAYKFLSGNYVCRVKPILAMPTFWKHLVLQPKPISDLPRFNYLNKSYQRWTGGHGWPH